MNSLSLIHWIIVLAVAASLFAPVAVILKRTGHSRAWAILALIPGVSLIALWIFAFIKWPALADTPQGEA